MNSRLSGHRAATRGASSLSFRVLRVPLLAFFLLGATAAHAVAPEVNISSPSDGSTFAIGDSITFTAAATDAVLLDIFKQQLMKQSDGIAIVAVENAVCQGCNMNIPPQMFNELLMEKVKSRPTFFLVQEAISPGYFAIGKKR